MPMVKASGEAREQGRQSDSKHWGMYQGEKGKQRDQLQRLFCSPSKSQLDLIRAQGEEWLAVFVLFPWL